MDLATSLGVLGAYFTFLVFDFLDYQMTPQDTMRRAIDWLDQNGGAHIADELRSALSQQPELSTASKSEQLLASHDHALRAEFQRMKSALAQQGEQQCDTARVLEWMRTPNRKAAQFAFTEGPERQAAYWIEIAQSEPAAQQMELGEQKPVAWAFKNEYGITLSEGDCTTLPNGVSTPLYAGAAPAAQPDTWTDDGGWTFPVERQIIQTR